MVTLLAVVLCGKSARAQALHSCVRASEPSQDRAESTWFRFANTCEFPVEVRSVGHDGVGRVLSSIVQGGSTRQYTQVGHRWVLTDSQGQCLHSFVAGRRERRVRLLRSQCPGPPPVAGASVSGQPAVVVSTAGQGRERAASVSAHGVVTAPPAGLGLSPFYERFVSARGVPVVSSSRASVAAVAEAQRVVSEMLSMRADIAARLVQARVRVAVMATTEVATDVPEHADLQRVFPQTQWDTRTRGVGATAARLASSCAEENLRCLAGDRYRGESILVHEFAHTMYTLGIAPFEPAFVRALEAAYTSAMARGLWAHTYAATNVDEYWAEGVQDWFDANRRAVPSNGVHNEVATRETLQRYDPELAALIAQVYGTSWRWSCP